MRALVGNRWRSLRIENRAISVDLRARVYNAIISKLTAGWYRAVLEQVPRGSRILDVGIGTGKALLANADLLRQNEVRVVGVDIDSSYIDACTRAVADAGLSDRVAVRLESIYDHCAGPYDAVYFSASFMVLPDSVAALRHVVELLAPNGRVYFTQTLEHERSAAMERIKPLLRFFTSIDFGQVTYEDDLLRTIEAGGVDVLENRTLETKRKRSFHLIVGAPASRDRR